MKKTQREKKALQLSAVDVFRRMGVAMEELLQATPSMLADGKFGGGQEILGKRKNEQKAA
ncbi:hypothetical protein EDWATA_00377 [Edwardsiella tarda ATCC 23685]|uniref:Uncharacterized protein n=1 Tax=Edwardsiella tarda ATCC 23685 TaxID=500638 RepID=D4F0Z7_EDWTA|nr:hypothetical protein [Edwardsiella tarda]EFE24657.1 hypothetical protein EDWATA_00377 [Edwardsiella tarda ATCC 23685]WGE28660.1 hypothetical protein PHA77_14515 [Edwardsiella tarda]GAC65006.1 hypothetical protein ET1_14_00600 [Edwardsiella tarda ATCC 15947 = NBRC 105688]STD49281.1 Uncharacterised protein [Edwardsiella tarda]